jgi:imidazole glycerol-phosphate synthase subunit HisF
MLKHRVIPALLLSNGGLVKTLRFKKAKYVGDPINAVRIFNEKEVDELIVLDITASKQKRDPDYALIEQIAGECFMPLAYGGGVRTLQQAKRIFASGVEKICVQTAALENPQFVREMADHFGSQSIVVSLDIKRNWLGRVQVFAAAQGKSICCDWMRLLLDLVEAGAGEVLLNVVNKDGTLSGPDLDLVHYASQLVGVPLIAAGGVSSLADIKSAVDAGASAVAAGAFFVYHGPHRAVLITYPKYHELEQLFLKT